MNEDNDIRVKACVVLGALGVGVILLASCAKIIMEKGIKQIAAAELSKISGDYLIKNQTNRASHMEQLSH